LVANYGSSGDEAEEVNDLGVEVAPPIAIKAKLAISKKARPDIKPMGDPNAGLRIVQAGTKSVSYNPTYQELFSPVVGPVVKHQKTGHNVQKNTWNGRVEEGDLDEFSFEDQRRTFATRGYAVDPSVNDGSFVSTQSFIGNRKKALKAHGETLATTSKTSKRKRDDPWKRFKDELRVARPSEEEIAKMAEWAVHDPEEGDEEDVGGAKAKKAKEARESKSTLHIKEEFDYQGRTYMHMDQTSGKKPEPPGKCFLPKKEIFAWRGHTKGVSTIRFLPGTAHLMVSGGLDGKAKLWEVHGQRRLLRTFHGHTKGIRDVCFNIDGSRFLTASFDKHIKLWDTETGECLMDVKRPREPICIKFHPSPEKAHLFVTGGYDKKIVTIDTNTSEIVQEYDRHLGAVNAIEFLEDGRKMVSTSDDKSIRIWEWDIPVDIKYIADPNMHSMPAITEHPNKKWLIFTSMDNSIVTFGGKDRFRQNKKKTFRGHMSAGYACQPDFSPDGSYVVSGDGNGFLWVWDWKTQKRFAKFKAHDDVCIGAFWHPFETSKVVTCGWDGVIKLWD